jgi:hypothetical protein
MGFGSYSSRWELDEVKAGFGTCPKCGKQTLQLRVYKNQHGERTYKNVCSDREHCGYEKEVS